MQGSLGELTHHEGEPAQSYASRLATHCGCATVREFLADFEISHDGLSSGRLPQVTALADLTGLDIDTLVNVTPSTRTGLVSFGEETFSLYYSRRNRIAGCPDCIAEDIANNPQLLPEAAAGLRMHWLLSPIMTCDKHCRPLVPLGKDLERGQRYDYALRLDGIQSLLPELMANQSQRSASNFELYVIDRLYGLATGTHWLDDLALNELFGVCANLGQKALAREDGFLKLNDAEQHAAYSAGFDIISRGREGLRDFFNQLIQTRELKVPLGPASLLGRTYTALLRSRKSWPKYQPILEPLANAVYDVLPYGPGDATLFDVPITHRRLFTPRQAGLRFGMVPKTLLRYAIANGIGTSIELSSQHGVRTWNTIDADGAERLFGQAPDHGWRKRLRAQGVSPKGLEAVIKTGLLKPIEVGEVPAVRAMAPLPMGAAATLMESFAERATLLDDMPDGCVKLARACRSVEGFGLLFHKVLDGSLWLGRLRSEEHFYTSLIIRLDEMKRIFRWHDSFSVRTAAKFAGLDASLIYAALDTGIVKAERKLELRSGQMELSLPRSTIELLKRDYIALVELGSGNPRKAGTIRAELDATGVTPAISARGSCAYLRSDVQRWLRP